MATIVKLTEAIINTIAAGEVIERPAYIVKELVDNALDAGATHIMVQLDGYGLERIEVIDNGAGMDREDLELAYQRHTTSKIRTAADLHAIDTFGFRGEALSSIAAVSTLTLSSRTTESVSGAQIHIQNGSAGQIKTVPMPIGTRILVEDIFTTVPARQKFLKSAQTEYRHILSLLQSYALSFPQIRIELYHNGQRVFLYPVSRDERHRLQLLFPQKTVDYLLPLLHEQEYITVRGYTSHPQLTYRSRSHHHLFLNHRAIEDTIINAAIKHAYGTLLSPVDYPFVILYLTVPHHLVDVNVHPRKEEVQFVDAKMVYEVVYDTISQTLAKQHLQFIDRRWQKKKTGTLFTPKDHGMKSVAAEMLRNKVLQPDKHITMGNELLQIHNLYVIVPTKQGILMIDQHAAHERVLYEKLMESYRKGIGQNELHQFEEPQSLALTIEERELLSEHRELLNASGIKFLIADDTRDVQITAIPLLLQDRPIEPLMREILDELRSSGNVADVDTHAHTMITYLACRSAIKAGDRLTQKQMKQLVHELNETEQPYTCPHGRPTQVVVELEYFNQIFKR